MSSTRRRVIGYAFLAAGILALVDILPAIFGRGIDNTWVFDVVALVLAVGFGAIAIGEDGLLRLAFSVAAVGWAVLALSVIISGDLGIPGLVGGIIALVGGVGGGVLVWLRKTFGGTADLLFLFAMGVTGLNLLFTVIGSVPFIVQVFIAAIWALDLITVGIFILRRR